MKTYLESERMYQELRNETIELFNIWIYYQASYSMKLLNINNLIKVKKLNNEFIKLGNLTDKIFNNQNKMIALLVEELEKREWYINATNGYFRVCDCI